MSRNESKSDWELFVADYVLERTVDRPDLGGFLTSGGGVNPYAIPDIACQLMVEEYDSESLCLAAGEDDGAPGLKELFDKALHEIGLLPFPKYDAALILVREYADMVVLGQISELKGISEIWGVLSAAQELRKEPPFDAISETENEMYYHWPYNEEKNRAFVRKACQAILEKYGSRR